MKKQLLWQLVFLLFLLESTLIPWLLPAWKVQISPHLVLTAVLFIGMFTNRHLALAYGLVFGLLQDVLFNAHMIGAYSFSLGLTGYLAGLAAGILPRNVFAALPIVMAGNVLYEMILYGVYRLFNITHVTIGWAFTELILPSMLAGVFFAIALYIPSRQYLEYMMTPDKKDDQEEQL